MADKESKTEKPTAKRLSQARKEGRIPRSPELVSWASIFIGLTIIRSTVSRASTYLQTIMNEMGQLISEPDQNKALHFMVTSISGCVTIVAPITLTFMTLGIAGTISQVRLNFSTKGIKPSFSKLNPFQGIKRLFSPQSAVQGAKQTLKLAVLGYVAYRSLHSTVLDLAGSGPYAIGEIIRVTSNAVVNFIRESALAMVVIGLLDYAYQRRKVGNSLKMSKQEIKEESRQQDLPPEVKSKLRQKQRQLSRNRMMAAIRSADVVIVNPVHIAVALKYDPERGAPRVVAKGAGFVAERIREKAHEHRVPLVQDIVLARTLHRSCDIDDEIPIALFEAVAKVLAFVFGLRSRGTSSGFHKMPGTPDLADVERMELGN